MYINVCMNCCTYIFKTRSYLEQNKYLGILNYK